MCGIGARPASVARRTAGRADGASAGGRADGASVAGG